jgi:hypothetical protein
VNTSAATYWTLVQWMAAPGVSDAIEGRIRVPAGEPESARVLKSSHDHSKGRTW